MLRIIENSTIFISHTLSDRHTGFLIRVLRNHDPRQLDPEPGENELASPFTYLYMDMHIPCREMCADGRV